MGSSKHRWAMPAPGHGRTSRLPRGVAAGLLAAALEAAAALAASPASAQGPPDALLDFEALPDGSAACEEGCPLTDAYREFGVVFAFESRFTGPAAAHLTPSGAFDPEDEVDNHSVTGTLTEQGFRPGILIVRFTDQPTRVRFRLRGPSIIRPAFRLRAYGSGGARLPEETMERRVVTEYKAARGGTFREERITVTGPDGLSRLELDGRGPPGHLLLLDDLALWR